MSGVQSHSKTSAWSILVAGILIAGVLGFGLYSINDTIASKRTSSDTYLESTVPLSGNRFAVVGGSITVYEVEPDGSVKFISHVVKDQVPAK